MDLVVFFFLHCQEVSLVVEEFSAFLFCQCSVSLQIFASSAGLSRDGKRTFATRRTVQTQYLELRSKAHSILTVETGEKGRRLEV